MIVWPGVMFMAVLTVSASPSGEVQRTILVLTCGWVIWLSFRVNHTTLTLDSSSSSVTTRISQNLSFFSENLKSVFNCSTGSSWSFGIITMNVMVGLS